MKKIAYLESYYLSRVTFLGYSKIVLILMVILSLAACRLEEAALSSTFQIHGVVAVGPVSEATISFYPINDNGTRSHSAVATTTSDSEGKFTLALPLAVLQKTRMFFVQAQGGTYSEEATGQSAVLSTPLSAFVVLPAKDSISITPFTTAAARYVESKSGGFSSVNMSEATQKAIRYLGFDPVMTSPIVRKDPTQVVQPHTISNAYAFALGVESQYRMDNQLNLSQTIEQIVAELQQGNFMDTTLEEAPGKDVGFTNPRLATVAYRYAHNLNNKSGIRSEEEAIALMKGIGKPPFRDYNQRYAAALTSIVYPNHCSANVAEWINDIQHACRIFHSAVIASLAEKSHDGPLRQPSRDLDEIYANAEIANEELRHRVNIIAAATQGKAEFPPGLKGRARSQEKIDNDYEGDASRLLDICRASLMFDNVSDIEKALTQISEQINIVRVKDRFNHPNETGYKDIMLNLKMQNGYICELQIHLKSLLAVKHVAHELYEELRTLEGETPKPITADVFNKVQNLSGLSQQLYDRAYIH